MPSVTCRQGCYGLVGPSCLLCHATDRPLSWVPQTGQPIASALPCRQSCCHAIGRPLSGVLWIDRDSGSSSCPYRGWVGIRCTSDFV
ncbi:hypothetical protein B296_00025202, partial [Ensete ventricosum]